MWLGNDRTTPIVVLSTGGNNFGKVRCEDLFRRFKQPLDKIRNKIKILVVCSVLSRWGQSVEWLSRVIAVNCRLANHCKSTTCTFIDKWNLFYGKDTLYGRNGTHLSLQGVRVLAGTLEQQINTLKH